VAELNNSAGALRLVARRAVDRSTGTIASGSATCARARAQPSYAGSPWSTLPWILPSDELLLELEHVLELV
jgi:hypothetical protein